MCGQTCIKHVVYVGHSAWLEQLFPGRSVSLAGHTTMWLDQLLPTFHPGQISQSRWTHHHVAGSAEAYLLHWTDQSL
jgi:hypothetical protein